MISLVMSSFVGEAMDREAFDLPAIDEAPPLEKESLI